MKRIGCEGWQALDVSGFQDILTYPLGMPSPSVLDYEVPPALAKNRPFS
ncbi:MAG: hypothetical protein V3T58_00010 [Candidatus Hydrothermarchaeales archaeon]